jgi:hypothetical protein
MTVIDAGRIDAMPMIAVGGAAAMESGPDTTALTPVTQPGPPVVKASIASKPAESSPASVRPLGRLDHVRSGPALWAAVLGGAALVVGTVLIARRDPPNAVTEPPPSAARAAAPLPSATGPASATLVDPPVESVVLQTVSVMDLPAVPYPSAAPALPAAPVLPRVAAAADAGPSVSAPLATLPTLPRPVSPPGVAVAAAAHGAPAPAASACSPPYYWDELGLKIFKPECVN